MWHDVTTRFSATSYMIVTIVTESWKNIKFPKLKIAETFRVFLNKFVLKISRNIYSSRSLHFWGVCCDFPRDRLIMRTHRTKFIWILEHLDSTHTGNSHRRARISRWAGVTYTSGSEFRQRVCAGSFEGCAPQSGEGLAPLGRQRASATRAAKG